MEQKPILQMSLSHQQLAFDLLMFGGIRFGFFKIKALAEKDDAPFSPVHIDLSALERFPDGKFAAIAVYQQLAKPLTFSLIAGIPTTASALASSLSDRLVVGLIIPKLPNKEASSNAVVEGFQEIDQGKTALLIDDFVSSDIAKYDAVDLLRNHRLQVTDIISLIDIGQKGSEEIEQKGCKLHVAFTIQQLLDFYVATGKMTQQRKEEISNALTTVENYLRK